MSDTPVIRISEAVKRYESSGSAFELHLPELQLAPGELCVVAGSSGCGKTTLLDVLGCMSRWTRCGSFELTCEGRTQALHGMSSGQLAALRRRYIGYILQQGGLLPYLTARENILLPLQMSGRSRAAAEAWELAEHLGVSGQLDKRPAALSIGQRQRICIVRALAGRPALLLADEPTGALDPVSAAEVQALLCRAARGLGVTTVIVTHDLALFRPVADRLLGFTLSAEGQTVRSVLHGDSEQPAEEGREEGV